MSLRTIATSKAKIQNYEEIRFDPKYFLVNNFFDDLEAKSSCLVTTLEDLCTTITSGSYIDEYISSEKGLPYIRVGNIKPFSIDEQETSLVFVSKLVPERIKAKKFDIVLGRTQATTEKLGVASIIDENSKGFVISQHISKITTDQKKISPLFLIGYLNSNFYKAQTSFATHGDTRVELTLHQLKNIRVFIPESKTLRTIEAKVEKIVENNRYSIMKINEAKELFKQSLAIRKYDDEKYFSENLSTIASFDIWNSNSHLPKYTNTETDLLLNYRSTKLGDIANIRKGIEVGSENYLTELFKNENDWAFIRTSDITNNEIDIFPDYFVSNSLASVSRNKTNTGDILFSKDGLIGEIAIVSKFDKVIVASGFAKISLKSKARGQLITPEYLFVALATEEVGLYQTKRRTVIASTIPHLRIERLKEIIIPIVDEETINRITELVRESTTLRDEKKKLIIEVKKEIDSLYDIK